MVRAVAIGAENRVRHRQGVGKRLDRAELARVGINVLPDKLALGGQLEKMPFRIGANQRVAVGESLRARGVARVELQALVVDPLDLLGNRIHFQHEGMACVSEVPPRGGAVVEDEDVAFAWRALLDHVRLVLPGEPAEVVTRIAPDNVLRLPVDDVDRVQTPGADDDVVRPEPSITPVEPLVLG